MDWRTFSTHLAAIIVGEVAVAAAGGLWIYFRRAQIPQKPWMIPVITAFATTVVTTLIIWLAVGIFGPPRFSAQGPHQIEVWTPTMKTKDTPGVKEGAKSRWMVLDDDKRLAAFADSMSHNRKRIVGFRWYEVVGRGEGSLQAGAWWVVTIGGDVTCTEFFQQYYGPTWDPGPDGVYYEINGMGDHWYQNQKCGLDW